MGIRIEPRLAIRYYDMREPWLGWTTTETKRGKIKNEEETKVHMGDTRPFRPGCDPHYFLHDLHEFSDFFENFSGSNGWNRREIRVVVDPFETYTINSLMKKKIIETSSIMSKALFWVAQRK